MNRKLVEKLIEGQDQAYMKNVYICASCSSSYGDDICVYISGTGEQPRYCCYDGDNVENRWFNITKMTYEQAETMLGSGAALKYIFDSL